MNIKYVSLLALLFVTGINAILPEEIINVAYGRYTRAHQDLLTCQQSKNFFGRPCSCINEEKILSQRIDEYNKVMSPMKAFLLPLLINIDFIETFLSIRTFVWSYWVPSFPIFSICGFLRMCLWNTFHLFQMCYLRVGWFHLLDSQNAFWSKSFFCLLEDSYCLEKERKNVPLQKILPIHHHQLSPYY